MHSFHGNKGGGFGNQNHHSNRPEVHSSESDYNNNINAHSKSAWGIKYLCMHAHYG